MTVYICKTCGRQNSANLTFCQDCGARLSAVASSLTPIANAPYHPPAPTPAVVGAPSFHPVAPTPAVEVGARPEPGSSARPALRLCGRCQGSSLPTAQFCKFCGNPFEGALTPMPGFASPAVPRSLSPAVPIAYVPEAAASGPQPANPGIAPLAAPVPVGAGPVAPPAASLPPVVSAQAAIVRITAVSKDGAERESYPLSDSLDIGRTEGDIRFADDRYLSDRHARVFVREGKVFLQDLGSVNGTYYRLKQVSFPIDDQDLILLGQQVIRFELVNREDWPGPGCEHGTLLFGTPGGRPFARLSQRGMEGVAMNVYYIRGQETVVGREIGDIVFTDDPFMSRRHAVFKRGDTGGFSITDVGSSNGTFVRLREAVPVAAGDEFRVGQQLFRVNPIEVRR